MNNMAQFFQHNRKFVEHRPKGRLSGNSRFSGEIARKEASYNVCLDNHDVNALLDNGVIELEINFN
ncbi:hypothetical protein [Vibrio agarivorans]|uniref:Uncharacterized protein n=1 Tax=Vibrio agarivorans TaxID=153622 RepID=A0ABT7Y787_9VIBR|nr:hypothetical protein [Vibrio agarivorans]MDN2483815.1 hypothetical protein [Vibrio agarivorans]